MADLMPIHVLAQFDLLSGPIKIDRWGEGHIHETFLVETESRRPDYILQKINHHIFRDIPGMMRNIEIVTRHIRQKLEVLPGHDPDRSSLNLTFTRSGQSFYQDAEGNFWRMFVFIPDTDTYQVMHDPMLGYEAGKCIGSFQSMLSGLETPLVETIPDFHNIDMRINQFNAAKSTDPALRAGEAKAGIAFAEERFPEMRSYYHSLKEKAVIRATHNDTKLNNILFDKHKKALCLIDLDTVMPGYVHFDYGDALRTMANTAIEDETDLSRVQFYVEVYDHFTRGYLETAGDILSYEERQLLPYAPIYMTFIIGLRFLTDYLNGDTYYRIHRPKHNMERAGVQFKLVSEMEQSLNYRRKN
ncbi:MAG: aminoglycoside phosphotransferase family protein [Bacteroidales bacterium]|nr:aminoglycoside phosphotransferase family protein [Bacteroidales bacterium]